MAAAAAGVLPEQAAVGALPEQYHLPEAFLVGDPVVRERNLILAGSYGAMAQHVTCVRGRAERQARARNPASFHSQTRGRVIQLRNMAQEALDQSADVVEAGGVAYPFPPELVAAINDLFQEYDVDGIPALMGDHAEAGEEAEAVVGED